MKVARNLEDYRVAFGYETMILPVTLPNGKRITYTPDFVIKPGFCIEAKGFLSRDDMIKFMAVSRQYPTLNLRFVFSNSKLQTHERERYSTWAKRAGFPFTDVDEIPMSWFK